MLKCLSQHNRLLLILLVLLSIGCGDDSAIVPVLREPKLEDFVTVSIDTLDFDPTPTARSFLLTNQNNMAAPWAIRSERDWLTVKPNQGLLMPWGAYQVTVTADPQAMNSWKEFVTLTVDIPIYDEQHLVTISAVNPSLHPTKQVLEALEQAFRTENLEKYLSQFWADGFLYESTMGIPRNRVPQQIRDLNIYMTEVQDIFQRYDQLQVRFDSINTMRGGLSSSQIEIEAHYTVKGRTATNQVTVTGHGQSRLSLERRGVDWRIREWYFDPALRRTVLLWM